MPRSRAPRHRRNDQRRHPERAPNSADDDPFSSNDLALYSALAAAGRGDLPAPMPDSTHGRSASMSGRGAAVSVQSAAGHRGDARRQADNADGWAPRRGCDQAEPTAGPPRSTLLADRLHRGQRRPRRRSAPGGPRLPQLARAAGAASSRRCRHHGRDRHATRSVRASPRPARRRRSQRARPHRRAAKRQASAIDQPAAAGCWNEPRRSPPALRARSRPCMPSGHDRSQSGSESEPSP